MAKTLTIESSELDKIIRKSIKEAISELEKGKGNNSDEKLLTISQVSKKLGKSFRTVKKWVDSGILKKTKSGLISEAALSEYLNG